MSSACGCDHDESAAQAGDEGEEQEALSWWQIGELQFAGAAGVFLLAAWIAHLSGAAHSLVTTLNAVALALGAWTFVPSAVRRLVRLRIGVGTLMTIAAVGAVLLGEVAEAAMLAFLYSISEGLEEYALARTRRGLRALLALVPEEALVVRDGRQVVVAPSGLVVGDVLVVRAGERVATDGTIRSGTSTLDVSALTGESMPVEAGVGQAVLAGALLSALVLARIPVMVFASLQASLLPGLAGLAASGDHTGFRKLLLRLPAVPQGGQGDHLHGRREGAGRQHRRKPRRRRPCPSGQRERRRRQP